MSNLRDEITDALIRVQEHRQHGDFAADEIITLFRDAMLSDEVVRVAEDAHWDSEWDPTNESMRDAITAALDAALEEQP